MKNSIIIAVLILFAIPAAAATYTWVDNRGTVNFTEDLGNVPSKYRKKVKVLDAEEEATPAEPVETIETVKPAPKVKGTEPAREHAVAVEKELRKTYGGKTSEAWEKEFGQLNAAIKASEDQLAELKGRLSDTSKMSRGDYLSIQRTIKIVEDRITGLRNKHDALNENANKAGVPKELRGQ